MIILQAAGIHKSFGVTKILEDVTLVVQDRRRVGLVGVNGSGKSTLLKIIAGLEHCDEGTLHTQRGLRIAYHAQLDELHSPLSVREEMEKVFEPVFEMERRLRQMEHDMAEHGDEAAFRKLSEDYDRLTRAYEEAGGYSWQSSVRGVLTGLGFAPEQYERAVDSLSGGERTRLKLAQLLLRGADLLLLDEPTNHLDLSAVAWLEGFLQSFAGSVVAVSHDRYFMDAICTDIAELSMRHLTQYEGNYSLYIQKRTADYEQRMKQYQLQQKYIQREEAIIRRFRGFATEKAIKRAFSRQKRLDQIERVERPTNEKEANFSFKAARGTGNDILIAEGMTKSYGTRVLFSDLHLHIRAGDRVAVIGPNGAGKTTLLRCLFGMETPDRGAVRLGSGVQVGYYDQRQEGLHPEKTVLDEVWDDFRLMEQTQLRGALAAFLIVGDEVFQPVDTLSGGERGRVLLTKLMLRQDNFLVLDEPTNHLDMDAREMLEDALFDFDGTMLVVSHDRFFINRLCDRVWVLEDGAVTEYLGNYDDYQEKLRAQAAPEVIEETRTKTQQREDKRREREAIEAARRERERRLNMETRIEELEQAMTNAEIEMSDPESYKDPAKAKSLAERYAGMKEQLETLYETWASME
jgi:ATP-binding cassette subfamily F protein 3